MYKTYLELFTIAYIRQHRRKMLPKNVVQRAIALIDKKLDNPCCDDSEATIDLIRDDKHNFLRFFEQALTLLPKRHAIASLNRTKAILQKNIGIPCCD